MKQILTFICDKANQPTEEELQEAIRVARTRDAYVDIHWGASASLRITPEADMDYCEEGVYLVNRLEEQMKYSKNNKEDY